MGRNSFDYRFKDACKPCGLPPFNVKPRGKCIQDAKNQCHWFSMCDLPEKTPWEKPTRPKEYKISKSK